MRPLGSASLTKEDVLVIVSSLFWRADRGDAGVQNQNADLRPACVLSLCARYTIAGEAG